MKPNRQQSPTLSTRVSRKSLIGIVVTASVLVIGVVTALSMQRGPSQKEQVEDIPLRATTQRSGNYVTSNAAGQLVTVNMQTGKVRRLTPEEGRRLAEGLKQLINQSTEGLVEIHRADGAVSMDLQGRFQNVVLAKKEDDGTITQACVDNLDAAGEFFEIDPGLLGAAARTSTSQPASQKIEDR